MDNDYCREYFLIINTVVVTLFLWNFLNVSFLIGFVSSPLLILYFIITCGDKLISKISEYQNIFDFIKQIIKK
jgi:hypothetical protein